MDIRIAVPQDTGTIARMAIAFRNHLERTEPTDEQFHAGIARLLDPGDAEFYLAVGEDGPLGYVLQRFRYSMWANGTEAAIEDLFVDPARRRQGAGRRLVAFALDRARERGCTTVCVDTNENNAASTRIYTQAGFSALSKRWGGRQVFFRLNF